MVALKGDDPQTKISAANPVLIVTGLVAASVLPVALIAAALLSPSVGRDVAGGAAIVVMPQMWFLLRRMGNAAPWSMVAWALGKYTLSGVGFALWFVFIPGAGLPATLAGAGLALIVNVVATAWCLRRMEAND